MKLLRWVPFALTLLSCKALPPISAEVRAADLPLHTACVSGKPDNCVALGDKTLQRGFTADNVGDAIVLFERACALGSTDGCARAGGLYLASPILQAEPRGLRLAEEACVKGSGLGCSVLADARWKSWRSKGVLDSIFSLYRRGCALGFARACTQLADALGYTNNSEFLGESPASWFEQGCTLGDDDGCHGLARQLANFEPDRMAEAHGLLSQACARRHGPSCARLAMWHVTGFGTTVDCEKAIALAKPECVKQDLGACASLGWCQLKTAGFGEGPQQRKGLQLLKLSCQSGLAFGCYHLAAALAKITSPSPSALTNAMVTMQDARGKPTELTSIVLKACTSGWTDACFAYGRAARRQDTEKWRNKGIAMFHTLCEEHIATACYELGVLYAEGNEVARDGARAKELLDRACQGGDPRACTYSVASEPPASTSTAPRLSGVAPALRIETQ